MSSRPCLVCGGALHQASLRGLLSCSSCRFTTADLALSRPEIENLYSERYFAGEEYRDYLAERELTERHFRSRLLTLLKYVDAPRSRRLFEIGSAYGFFLSVAAEHFARVEGIDISRDAASYAADVLKLPVRPGDFLESDVEGPIDVLCLWDTIEHLARPECYLKKAAALMPAGSVVAITTGDIGSAVARLRGAKWRQIHPPSHLHYFSKATLTRLLAKHGFEIRYCGHDGMYRSADMIAFIILTIKHRQPRLYRALKRAGLLRWNLYLNLYDILFVIAAKT